MNFLGKLKRELIVFFSKTCVKSARNDYLGLDLHYPIIYGMGRGYVIPAELWMGQCLDAFLRTKQGCVIDVGVNVGVYLVKLKVLRDDIEYIGFEPNAVCNYYTNELIRINNFKKARVLPVALSNELCVRTLYANKIGDKTASLLVNEGTDSAAFGHSSDIVTVKGDTFIEMLDVNEIAVIKIDVEGAELFVLNGLINTIETFRPFLYAEVWASQKNPQEVDRVTQIYKLMTELDYSILSITSEQELKVIRMPDDFFKQYDPNYMFIPNHLLEDFIKNIELVGGVK